jgi:hypothetical protein
VPSGLLADPAEDLQSSTSLRQRRRILISFDILCGGTAFSSSLAVALFGDMLVYEPNDLTWER